MNRRAAITLVAYALLMISLVTGLYEPLTTGRDDSWLLVFFFAGAQIGLGVGVARAWVLVIPVVVAIIGFVVGGAEGLAWLTLIFGAPALVVVTVLGLVLSRLIASARAPIGVGAFVVALVPAGFALNEWRQRGPHVPPSVQAALPTDVSINDLCAGPSGSALPRGEATEIRRKTDALIRELHRRPHDLVTYTYYYSDEPDETHDITVRELAEEQLKDLDEPGCPAELRDRIRAALDG